MARPRLTKGNIQFFNKLAEVLSAHLKESASTDGILGELRADIISFEAAKSTLDKIAGRVAAASPPALTIDPDGSSGMLPGHGWMDLICADLVTRATGGEGTVSSVGEALSIATALAKPWEAKEVFYRGEHRYGYSLTSRAARNMTDAEKDNDGITDRELQELARFQAEVKADAKLSSTIAPGGKLPSDDSPVWLPLMQHYDSSFGTRLMDLTSSIFAGLHFACVAWDGSIDDSLDGLLYIFFQPGARWRRYCEITLGDPGLEEIVAARVQDSFRNWKCPDYAHLYKSSLWSPRQLAQDGVFLTHGNLKHSPDMGQFFKLRIPASAKARIAQELSFAGYTGERILGGLSVTAAP